MALLIDGDNISSELIEQLLIEAGKLGGVTIKLAYGNWTKPFVKKWHDAFPRYGITAVHLTQTANGKNATDIAMAIDAMDYDSLFEVRKRENGHPEMRMIG
ncbi:MAG TPA: NYN domain-containing protein [Ktedonobacteraceae bacterium]